MADRDTGSGEAGSVASQPADKARRSRTALWNWTRVVVPVLIVLGLMVFAASRMHLIPHRFATLFAADFEPGVFPNCDSEFATDLLKDSVNSSPKFKKMGLQLVDVTELKDLHSLTTEKKKWCSALLQTSGGKVSVWYWMEWKDAAKTEISLSASSL